MGRHKREILMSFSDNQKKSLKENLRKTISQRFKSIMENMEIIEGLQDDKFKDRVNPDKLKEVIRKEYFSENDMAEIMLCQHQYVNDVKNADDISRTFRANIFHFYMLAQNLDLSLDYIFGRTENKHSHKSNAGWKTEGIEQYLRSIYYLKKYSNFEFDSSDRITGQFLDEIAAVMEKELKNEDDEIDLLIKNYSKYHLHNNEILDDIEYQKKVVSLNSFRDAIVNRYINVDIYADEVLGKPIEEPISDKGRMEERRKLLEANIIEHFNKNSISDLKSQEDIDKLQEFVDELLDDERKECMHELEN